MSDRRTQEKSDSFESSGLRWFEVKTALAAKGTCEAYPASWGRGEEEWVRDTGLPVRTIYSTREHITADIGDFVLCRLNPAGRLWEVIYVARPTKQFCVTNSQLVHGSSVLAEILVRESNTWQRSGATVTAYDLFLNAADTVEQGTIITVVPYQGLKVIDCIYCDVNDWLDL